MYPYRKQTGSIHPIVTININEEEMSRVRERSVSIVLSLQDRGSDLEGRVMVPLRGGGDGHCLIDCPRVNSVEDHFLEDHFLGKLPLPFPLGGGTTSRNVPAHGLPPSFSTCPRPCSPSLLLYMSLSLFFLPVPNRTPFLQTDTQTVRHRRPLSGQSFIRWPECNSTSRSSPRRPAISTQSRQTD